MRLGILIGVLTTAVVALGVALAVVVSGDDSGKDRTVVRSVTTKSTVTKTTTMPTTTTTPTSETTTTPATRVVHLDMFRLPSGNIGCAMIGVARCDIRHRSWSPPPRPASCDLDWAQGILVGDSGAARFVCAGDTANDPSAPVLAYGENSRVGRFSCASRTDGATCTNRLTGHGFLVNRERYRLF